MEEWQKDWVKLCETLASGVEQFLAEVEEEMTEWVEAIAEISLDISEAVENLVFEDLEIYLSQWLEPITQLHLDTPAEDPFYNPTGEYASEDREHPACTGCRHYHGQVYGGTLLVCAMHPYGWEDTSCPDWEG